MTKKKTSRQEGWDLTYVIISFYEFYVFKNVTKNTNNKQANKVTNTKPKINGTKQDIQL